MHVCECVYVLFFASPLKPKLRPFHLLLLLSVKTVIVLMLLTSLVYNSLWLWVWLSMTLRSNQLTCPDIDQSWSEWKGSLFSLRALSLNLMESCFCLEISSQNNTVLQLYWAIQQSWFARVNTLCNLLRKTSREVAAHFRADFWEGVDSRCV